MQIHVSPETQEKIERFVATGEFHSADEVVQVAIDHLSEVENTIAHIQQGLDDEVARRLRSLAEGDRQIRERHKIPEA